MKKRRAITLVLVLAILVFISALPIKRAFLSGLVLSELLNFDSRGWLEIFTDTPQIKEVSYRGPLGIVKADLYLPQPGRKGSGILLNHGVIDTGKDDPRLKRFAAILCRAGFVVFVPDLKGMRSFHISPSDIDEIQAAFEDIHLPRRDSSEFVRAFWLQLRGRADDHRCLSSRNPGESTFRGLLRRIL